MKIKPIPLLFSFTNINIKIHKPIINISEPKKEKNLNIAVLNGFINLLILL